MKYVLLDWKCEYDGHYDLEVEVNQIDDVNNDVPGDLTEVNALAFQFIFVYIFLYIIFTSGW